jgi:hypothetical protein
MAEALSRANDLLVQRGYGAVSVEAPATGAAAGTPEPMRGVDADTGVASDRDDEGDLAAFVQLSPEAFAACGEDANRTAPAPVPAPADDNVFDEEGAKVEMEQEQEATAAAAAAAAAATGSTGGAVSPSPKPKKDEAGSPSAGGKRDRSPAKAGQSTPSAGRGLPSPKHDLSGISKIQLGTE